MMRGTSLCSQATAIIMLAVLAACSPADCDPSRAGFLAGIGCISGGYAAREARLHNDLAAAQANELQRQAQVAQSLPWPLILASRAFAGPTQYPPSRFAAYGIVAFTSRAMSDDLPRYHMICNAYITSLLSYREVPAPIQRQMVTVWPIETDSAANLINAMIPNDKLCEKAVDSYGLMTALIAIDDAKRSHAELDGLGPFLLAWSPSGQKGRPDALVLVSNLSNVTTFEQAKQVLLRWSHDVVENPDLWENGWNEEKLKLTIRLWADRYGPRILKIFGASE
jgi:hypothetical protein